jgi:outer membrane PBP1 activator LpoA protein
VHLRFFAILKKTFTSAGVETNKSQGVDFQAKPRAKLSKYHHHITRSSGQTSRSAPSQSAAKVELFYDHHSLFAVFIINSLVSTLRPTSFHRRSIVNNFNPNRVNAAEKELQRHKNE